MDGREGKKSKKNPPGKLYHHRSGNTDLGLHGWYYLPVRQHRDVLSRTLYGPATGAVFYGCLIDEWLPRSGHHGDVISTNTAVVPRQLSRSLLDKTAQP